MQRLALGLALTTGIVSLAACGPPEPDWDENAWYARDEAEVDPSAWAQATWAYRYWSQPEELILAAGGHYHWRRDLSDGTVQTDAGVWTAERSGVFLESDTDLAGTFQGPPAELRRVPTATGIQLVPPGTLRRWQERGFRSGDVPMGGRSFVWLGVTTDEP